MSISYKDLASLAFTLIFTVIIFTGCENPANVGGDLVEGSRLQFDTLSVDDLTVESLNGYTGLLSSFGMGSYDDPVFGDIHAIGMVKPILSTVIVPNGDELTSDYKIQLSLKFNDAVYGDTLSDLSFSIYEITKAWRANAWTQADVIEYNDGNQLGFFEYSSEADSIIVDLSDEWRDKLATYVNDDTSNADSLYKYNFFGLAFVSNSNANKIIFPNLNTSKFLVIDEVQEDTLSFSLGNWAYDLKRGQANLPENTFELSTPVDQIINLDISSVLSEFENKNFIKADLVLYENEEYIRMQSPENVVRPAIPSLNMDLKEEEEVVYQIQFGVHEFFGERFRQPDFYRFNISDYVNNLLYGSEDETGLTVSLSSAAGIIRSTAIYNHLASPSLQPKIVITSIVEE